MDSSLAPADLWRLADRLFHRDDARRAAAVIDAAFTLDPRDVGLARARKWILDGLAIEELGIRWRYVPAGTFLMGSESGDPDERPVHPATPGELWMADVPVTWAAYCDLSKWTPPPEARPIADPTSADPLGDDPVYRTFNTNKIRLQYCESETLQARDWHSHAPHLVWQDGAGNVVPGDAVTNPPWRENPDRPFRYDRKPMVAVAWQEAVAFGRRISTATVTYRLPTEAEWEKCARGGLAGCRWSWGDAPPDSSRCDFGHFGKFCVRDPATLPPNGYGLHGMCGGVWEWTSDPYDALAYRRIAPAMAAPETIERVLRGGSWADCARACTVSFRMSQSEGPNGGMSPNVGFRLCRVEKPAVASPPSPGA